MNPDNPLLSHSFLMWLLSQSKVTNYSHEQCSGSVPGSILRLSWSRWAFQKAVEAIENGILKLTLQMVLASPWETPFQDAGGCRWGWILAKQCPPLRQALATPGHLIPSQIKMITVADVMWARPGPVVRRFCRSFLILTTLFGGDLHCILV